MKIMNLKSFLLLAVSFLMLSGLWSCKTPTVIENEYGSANFKTECIGVDPDGSLMLRTWGNGINKDKAIEQAKRKAVETVIFTGLTSNNEQYKYRPLVTEVNARDRYEDFFSAFFSNNGAYKEFVKLEEKRTSRIKASNSSMEAWGVVVILDRNALKQHLAAYGVIKH